MSILSLRRPPGQVEGIEPLGSPLPLPEVVSGDAIRPSCPEFPAATVPWAATG